MILKKKTSTTMQEYHQVDYYFNVLGGSYKRLSNHNEGAFTGIINHYSSVTNVLESKYILTEVVTSRKDGEDFYAGLEVVKITFKYCSSNNLHLWSAEKIENKNESH